MKPYYSDDLIEIFHGDCRDVMPWVLRDPPEVALICDPPYGGDYRSNRPRLEGNERSIANDKDTKIRDAILALWATRGPALVFGTWRIERPAGTKGVLIWDKGGALGMGDLSLPWKFDHEEIYVIGGPFSGRRDSGSVLRHPPEQSMGRAHPNQKPVGLLSMLLAKVPPVPVLDPCMGVGSTLVAAKARGRHAIGIELDEAYCEIAAKRCSQEVLDLGGVA